ncbi:MAG: hypothetical protein GX092_06720 [Clostridia bacterium]|nr:hypothetical protein [Clostridia bacterium]
MSVLNQAMIFFLVLVWGNFVGLIFDCYRLFRQIWRLGFWGTSLGDLFFWLIVTFLTYLFLMLISWGEVRFYVFLGIGIGLIIYFKLFSPSVRWFLRKIFFYCKLLFFNLYKILSKPVKIFCKMAHHLKKGVFRLM